MRVSSEAMESVYSYVKNHFKKSESACSNLEIVNSEDKPAKSSTFRLCTNPCVWKVNLHTKMADSSKPGGQTTYQSRAFNLEVRCSKNEPWG